MKLLFAKEDSLTIRESLRSQLHALETAPVLSSNRPDAKPTIDSCRRQAKILRKLLNRLAKEAGWSWEHEY